MEYSYILEPLAELEVDVEGLEGHDEEWQT